MLESLIAQSAGNLLSPFPGHHAGRAPRPSMASSALTTMPPHSGNPRPCRLQHPRARRCEVIRFDAPQPLRTPHRRWAPVQWISISSPNSRHDMITRRVEQRDQGDSRSTRSAGMPATRATIGYTGSARVRNGSAGNAETPNQGGDSRLRAHCPSAVQRDVRGFGMRQTVPSAPVVVAPMRRLPEVRTTDLITRCCRGGRESVGIGRGQASAALEDAHEVPGSAWPRPHKAQYPPRWKR